MEFKFELGEVLKDTITGLRGVVMGRTQYITGCNHYGLLVRKLNKDGKVPDWEWMDEMRLQKAGEKISFHSAPIPKVGKPKNGGPTQNAPSW